MRLLGDLSHSEEVANDAFWRLYRQPALQADGNVVGWLYRTASNLGSMRCALLVDAVYAKWLPDEPRAKAGMGGRWTTCCVKRNAGEYVLCWPRSSPLRRSS
jgi:hypothetical protein